MANEVASRPLGWRMNPIRDPRHKSTPLRRLALIFGRAARSTLLVAAVVVIVSILNDGVFQWAAIVRVTGANRALFAMVFLGFLVWDFWFPRGKRRAAYRRPTPD